MMGWFQKQAACVGKEALTSPTLAHSVNKRRRKSGKIGTVYRCDNCGHWHIGTPMKAMAK